MSSREWPSTAAAEADRVCETDKAGEMACNGGETTGIGWRWGVVLAAGLAAAVAAAAAGRPGGNLGCIAMRSVAAVYGDDETGRRSGRAGGAGEGGDGEDVVRGKQEWIWSKQSDGANQSVRCSYSGQVVVTGGGCADWTPPVLLRPGKTCKKEYHQRASERASTVIVKWRSWTRTRGAGDSLRSSESRVSLSSRHGRWRCGVVCVDDG
jgi:hypothetical protein